MPIEASPDEIRWTEADNALRAQAGGPHGLSSYATSTGQSVSTLRRWARVARAFPVAQRRRDLSFSHHEAVAGAERRGELLADAARNAWSVSALKNAVSLSAPAPSQSKAAVKTMSPAAIDNAIDYLQALDRLGQPVVARLSPRLELLADMAGDLAARCRSKGGAAS